MEIENILAQMTLEEKVSLLAGADLWYTIPVERLGVPAIKVTDGPVGARGASGSSGPRSACFPAGVALAATWNPELVQRVGEALADEVKAKGAHILLAPTVNIHRSPLAGRNFECYSEDPYLAGRMATAYILGLQNKGVGACIKHFCCNDSEFERNSISSEVPERALREIYLQPFRTAIREAQPWAVMSAYNRLNGVYCSENKNLLLEILKGEWGFDGIVMSDWNGSYSDEVANGGLDLEMPGPGRWLGAERVLALARSGRVSQATIDDKVRRLLRTMQRVGAFNDPDTKPEQAIDRPEHRALIRDAAGEAIVLLKNAGELLPLDIEKVQSIAVIGENAKWAQIRGGGSADVTPHYIVSPLEGLQEAFGSRAQVRYALGTPIDRFITLLDPSWLTQGLDVVLFDNLTLAGSPSGVWHTDRTNIAWSDEYLKAVNPQKFSARLAGKLMLPEAGCYQFGLSGNGQYRLILDGKILLDMWAENLGDIAPWDRGETLVKVDLVGGKAYDLQIDYAWEGQTPWRSLRIGCRPPQPEDPIGEAVQLARRCDVTIVFAGLTNEWESEGSDRVDMELPGRQAELIERVAAANPRTVVVLNGGSPVRMPWLDRVAAVLETWYAGQEAGTAIADVLSGKLNPSGKLPTTFPKRLEDNPAYINYPGENGRVYYGEGIFVGYRYYDKKDVEPLFPFGYGLSYTSYEYRNLRLDKASYEPGEKLQISVDVQNIGKRAGKEVVQLYIQDIASSLARPPKELKAFAKLALAPGETQTVNFTLGEEALMFYDDKRRAWVAEAGTFEILIGASSRDIRLRAAFEWQREVVAPIAPQTVSQAATSRRFHLGTPIGILLKDAAAKAVLRKYFGALLDHPDLEMAAGMSLDQLASMMPDLLKPEILQAVDEDLAKL